MNGKSAFKDGDFRVHSKALDAYYWALESNLLSSTLWNYCSDVYSSPMFPKLQNTHVLGDQFNGENLSVWSRDTPGDSDIPEVADLIGESSGCRRMSNTDYAVESTFAFTFPYKGLDKGSRAFRAFVRPSPIVIAGEPKQYGFDMRSCTFTLRMMPFHPEDEPTEIFLPAYLCYDRGLKISGSSGRCALYRYVQVLRWWHIGSGEQTLTVQWAGVRNASPIWHTLPIKIY
jgi:hypothetical protein